MLPLAIIIISYPFNTVFFVVAVDMWLLTAPPCCQLPQKKIHTYDFKIIDTGNVIRFIIQPIVKA